MCVCVYTVVVCVFSASFHDVNGSFIILFPDISVGCCSPLLQQVPGVCVCRLCANTCECVCVCVFDELVLCGSADLLGGQRPWVVKTHIHILCLWGGGGDVKCEESWLLYIAT